MVVIHRQASSLEPPVAPRVAGQTLLCSCRTCHPGCEQHAVGTKTGTCGFEALEALLPTLAELCGHRSPQQLSPGGVFQQHCRVPHHHQERLGTGDCHVEAPRGAPKAQVGICRAGSAGRVRRLGARQGRAGRGQPGQRPGQRLQGNRPLQGTCQLARQGVYAHLRPQHGQADLAPQTQACCKSQGRAEHITSGIGNSDKHRKQCVRRC